MFNATARYTEDFLGAQVLDVIAAAATPFASLAIKTNGAPTIKGVTGFAAGAVELLLDNTNEAQYAILYHGDICSFKADDLQTVLFRLKTDTNITTAQTLVFGMTTARNNNPDNTTVNVQFKLAASTAVLCESDDDTTNNDDKATGQTLATTTKEFMIDFRQGLADVRFFMSDANGKLRRVAAGTTFNIAAATGTYLQPLVTLDKTGGTTTPNVKVDLIDISFRRS